MLTNIKNVINLFLKGAMDVALGSAATGVFTNSDWLWEQLHKVPLKRSTNTSASQLLSWLTMCVCRLVLWQVTEFGGCLCSNITQIRWLTASWLTSTTSASTAGTCLTLPHYNTHGFREVPLRLCFLVFDNSVCISVVLVGHAQQLRSWRSLSHLLTGPIWTLLAWWATEMKFPT